MANLHIEGKTFHKKSAVQTPLKEFSSLKASLQIDSNLIAFVHASTLFLKTNQKVLKLKSSAQQK